MKLGYFHEEPKLYVKCDWKVFNKYYEKCRECYKLETINIVESINGNDRDARRQYFSSKNNTDMRNEGVINNMKDLDCIWFFYMNDITVLNSKLMHFQN